MIKEGSGQNRKEKGSCLRNGASEWLQGHFYGLIVPVFEGEHLKWLPWHFYAAL